VPATRRCRGDLKLLFCFTASRAASSWSAPSTLAARIALQCPSISSRRSRASGRICGPAARTENPIEKGSPCGEFAGEFRAVPVLGGGQGNPFEEASDERTNTAACDLSSLSSFGRSSSGTNHRSSRAT